MAGRVDGDRSQRVKGGLRTDVSGLAPRRSAAGSAGDLYALEEHVFGIP